MKYEKIINRVAVSKNKKKLGRIFNIEKLPGETIKIKKNHSQLLRLEGFSRMIYTLPYLLKK